METVSDIHDEAFDAAYAHAQQQWPNSGPEAWGNYARHRAATPPALSKEELTDNFELARRRWPNSGPTAWADYARDATRRHATSEGGPQ